MKLEKNLIIFMPFIGGGGVEKNLYIISNFLSQRFKNLYICTLSRNKRNKFNKKIKFIHPNLNFSKNVNIRIKYLICLYTLFKFLIKNKRSLIMSFQANIYCVLLCKLLNKKIIVRSNSSPSGWYHNLFKRIVYRNIISMADTIITNSYDFKNQMQKIIKKKVECVFNPLDKDQIIGKSKKKIKDSFFKNSNSLKILNIGRLTKQKDQITILRSAQILRKNNINFKILIIGSGIEKNNLKKFIYKNNLKKFIKIINFVENPYPYLKQCNLFILSSIYEGLPNVLLEAATMKKFIISTNCPTGPREILDNGKGGLFFKIRDYYDLSKKIIDFKKNKFNNTMKINHNFKRLERFNHDNNLNKYLKIIEKNF